jgi:hypothetical protein
LANDFGQAQVAHQGHEDKESAQACAEGARGEILDTHISDGRGFRLRDGRSFVVASAW